MKSFSTLLEIILACENNHKRGITFIESSKEEKRITYDQIFRKAHYVLYNLNRRGIKKGDELVFQVKDNETFIYTFWGCILGGIRPVPITLGSNTQSKEKVYKVWNVLKKPYLIVDEEHLKDLENYSENYGFELTLEKMKNSIIEIEEALEEKVIGIPKVANSRELAFIQFSSGSTGDPKGVMLSHENVMTNIKAITEGMNCTSKDIALSWMPLTHDMGLIGFLLTPMMNQIDLYLMTTTLFIRRPSLWLQKAHEHQVTVLSSPNFGYRYYLTRFKAKENNELDLSSVRLIFNGAEPISARNIIEFLDRMEVYNLKRNVIFNVYGLAEASLAVSFPKVDEPMNYICVNRGCLGIGETVDMVLEEDVNCARIVEVGLPIPDSFVEIYNDVEECCAENVVGHIYIKGKNVTKGYYGNDRLNKNSFSTQGWLKTGDLGFIHKGRLYVTGRVKDILFINGQNHYAHDLESILCELDEFSEGKVVVVGVFDKELEKEKLIIFIYHKGNIDRFLQLYNVAQKKIKSTVGIEPDYIIPIKKIPKTTSGKIQRYQLIHSFERGEYDEVIEALNEVVLDDEQIVMEDPQTETEGVILEIVKSVLQTDPINVSRNLTELVEGSLQLISIQSEIDEVYPGRLKVSDLFVYPSIRELADYIDKYQKESIRSIPLPEEFFTVKPSQEDGNFFEVKVSSELVEGIYRFSKDYGMQPFAVLAYAYLVLFQKITKLDNITVQGLPTGKNILRVLDSSVVKECDLVEGIKLVDEILTSETKGIAIEALQEQRISKGARGIIPLVVEGNCIDNQGIKLVFDIVLQTIINNDDISLYWNLNSLRLNKEKVKDISNGFVKLIQLIVL